MERLEYTQHLSCFSKKYAIEGDRFSNFIKKSNIDESQMKNYFSTKKIGLLIILNHVHGKQWPYKLTKYKREYSESFPIVWAFLYLDDNSNFQLYFHIHPVKCLPSIYANSSTDLEVKSFALDCTELDDVKYTIGGCRYTISNGKHKYKLGNTFDYCLNFGLPDTCYSPELVDNLLYYLEQHAKMNIWMFEQNEFSNQLTHKTNHEYHYIEQEILPAFKYFYKDKSLNALRGIMTNKKRELFSKSVWFDSGKHLIHSINSEAKIDIMEELIILKLRNKIMDEFERMIVLMMNRDKFDKIGGLELPKIDYGNKNDSEFDRIERLVKAKMDTFSNRIMIQMQNNDIIDMDKLKNKRFMVFDIEHIHLLNPINDVDSQTFNFPSIFSSIVWEGIRKGPTLEINYFSLPCHYCPDVCDNPKKGHIKYQCASYSLDFINAQKKLFQNMLIQHNNFKIYSFGKNDPKQFEYANSYLWDNEEEFKRKNRAASKTLSEFTIDLSKGNKSLQYIEDIIIKPQLNGWKRPIIHKKVNHEFLKLRNGSPHWKGGFYNSLLCCSSDALSAFLYLLLKEYSN